MANGVHLRPGWVRIAKWVLPLVAFGIVVSLFVPFDQSTHEEYIEPGQRPPRADLKGTVLSLRTADDSEVAVSARMAESSQSAVSFDDVSARLKLAEGKSFEFNSEAGKIFKLEGDRVIRLTGSLAASTSFGYSLETDGLEIWPDTPKFTSLGEVRFWFPTGQGKAGRVHMDGTPGTAHSRSLIFDKGVFVAFDYR